MTKQDYMDQGEKLEKESKYKEALDSYIKACEAFPDDEELEDKAAFLAYRLGLYPIAVEYGTKAVEHNPSSDKRLSDNLGFYNRGLEYTQKTGNDIPKAFATAYHYYNDKNYSSAIGIFEDSLEEMSDEFKALSCYYCGLSYKKLGKKLESMKNFSISIDFAPNFRNAYLEMFRLLEEIKDWEDLEIYLKSAWEEKDEECRLNTGIKDWESLVLMQTAYALSKQNKYEEAYGYSELSLNYPMSESRRKTAEKNREEILKVLKGELQL